MASQEELDREKKINDILNERVGISEDLLSDQQDIANLLLDQAKNIQFAKVEQSQLRSIARSLTKTAQENYNINSKELTLKKTSDKLSKDSVELQKKINSLGQINVKELTNNKKLQAEIRDNIDEQITRAKQLKEETDQLNEKAKAVSKNFGAKSFSAVEDLVKSVPGLRQFSEPFTKAADAARATAISGKNGAQAFAAGAQSLAQSAKAALPLLLLNELVKTFKFLDESSGKLAKNLGISYNEALGLTQELTDSAIASNSLFINTKNLVNSQLEISSALGTNAKLNQELLVTQTKLTKQAGYSVEAATQLSTLSLATGKSTEEITTQFLGQAKALNLNNKLALNEKQLLESVAKTSKGTLATFASKPKELAKAVFEAKKLGLEISQVEKIADGLLDIEQSLTAEFEAEVISGKQLNLERARFFALTNDIAGVSEELGKQGITQASFAKSSRIEQEAVAAAMGMSRDELGQMLIEQNALAAVGAKDGEEARAKFEALKAQHGEAYAIAHLGDETYAQQLASVSTQEKLVEVTNKLRDAFVSIAGPLMEIITPIVDILAPVLTGVSYVIKSIAEGFKTILPILTPIVALLGLMYAKTIGLAIATAAQAAFTALGGLPIVGPALALGAIGAASLAIKSQSNPQNVQDGIAPSEKGPFTITDSYGATAITAKGDGLAVSPNIRREERNTTINNTNNRNSFQKVTVTLSKEDIKSIADAVKDGASKANINVNLDGNRISNNIQTPLAVNTRKYAI
jgi:hypothetical protein